MSCVTRTSFTLCRLRNQRNKKCMWLLNNYRFCSSSDNSEKQETIINEKKAENSKTDSEHQEKKNKAAKGKLMSLLSDMASKSFVTPTSSVKISLPKQHLKTKEDIKNQPKTSPEMMSAVKSVASLAGSQAEKVEAELTESLQTIGRIKDEDEDDVLEEVEDDVLDQELEGVASKVSQENIMASAVEAVATSISGAPEETQSELTKKLLSLATQSGAENVETDKIKSIFKGMKVDTPKRTDASAEQRVPADKFARKSPPRIDEKIDLFGDAPLGIFTVAGDSEKLRDCSVFWEKLQQKELKSLVTFAPTNPFQEMIQLTEQGKHWKFPIDNFSEIGQEENVGFHEHVFLEQHLHGFPKKGPVRHFMELVCVGLSKNPYITVERKIKNIDWYRQYFKDKEHILQEYGVLDGNTPALESN